MKKRGGGESGEEERKIPKTAKAIQRNCVWKHHNRKLKAKLEVKEMDQWIKCLPCKHRDGTHTSYADTIVTYTSA